MLNIIDQLRITIPQEIKRCREIEEQRERWIAEARKEAQRIIAQAHEDATRLRDEHRIRKEAEREAEQILQRARREALEIREGADRYAEEQLHFLNDQVARLQQVIRNGLQQIEANRAERSAALQEASQEPVPQAIPQGDDPPLESPDA